MRRSYQLPIVAALLVVALAACGDDDDGDSVAADTATEPTGSSADEGTTVEGEPASNACPPEGCEIEFVSVETEGEELAVTWTANFAPDLARNHIHIYWDTYDADQVSSDAEARGVEQGDWLPTDAYPVLVTEGAVSVAAADGSTMLCATAADRDHAVLDSSIVNCVDVSDQLS